LFPPRVTVFDTLGNFIWGERRGTLGILITESAAMHERKQIAIEMGIPK